MAVTFKIYSLLVLRSGCLTSVQGVREEFLSLNSEQIVSVQLCYFSSYCHLMLLTHALDLLCMQLGVDFLLIRFSFHLTAYVL
jgi:hypothetical protein